MYLASICIYLAASYGLVAGTGLDLVDESNEASYLVLEPIMRPFEALSDPYIALAPRVVDTLSWGQPGNLNPYALGAPMIVVLITTDY